MRLLSSALRFLMMMSVILLGETSAVLARSWSYHYHPKVEEPTAVATPAKAAPNTSEQSGEAKLLKRAIVSDLAIYAQDQNPQPNGAYGDQIVSRLSRFDSMNSSEALNVFASLSGYYLGAPAEKLYYCLALRKGKPLGPHLQQYLHNASAECLSDLGQNFTRPSAALDGYAVCRSAEQQTVRLRNLIVNIDSGESCTDSDLAGLTRSLHK
jgi:hypothetical protein